MGDWLLRTHDGFSTTTALTATLSAPCVSQRVAAWCDGGAGNEEQVKYGKAVGELSAPLWWAVELSFGTTTRTERKPPAPRTQRRWRRPRWRGQRQPQRQPLRQPHTGDNEAATLHIYMYVRRVFTMDAPLPILPLAAGWLARR